MKDIDGIIENYREALISRGVEDGEWLKGFLNRQKVTMQQQLSNDISVGRGQAEPKRIDESSGAFPEFYDMAYQEYLKSNKK